MKTVILTLVTLAVAAALTGAAVILGGLYDISATDQHLAPTYKVLDTALRRAVKRRADELEVPPLDGAGTIERGLSLYHEHCVQCHGAPGVAPQPFALGLTPLAANLAYTAREWGAAELFWVVKNGIKMTAMPAWEFRLSDAEMWAVVAFMEKLPELSPMDYRAALARLRPAAAPSQAQTGAAEAEVAPGTASVARGRQAMLQYACVTCHRIPGVVGPNAPVGPPLEGIGTRAFIAGVLPNEPHHMVRWLRSPQAVNPLSAMPDLGVGERDARDMAAFLATLR